MTDADYALPGAAAAAAAAAAMSAAEDGGSAEDAGGNSDVPRGGVAPAVLDLIASASSSAGQLPPAAAPRRRRQPAVPWSGAFGPPADRGDYGDGDDGDDDEAAAAAPPQRRARRAAGGGVDASAARGAGVSVVMFEPEADRYRDTGGAYGAYEDVDEYHARRVEFRLRVRSHPAAQFLDKVHGFTSGATRSFTLEGAAITAEMEALGAGRRGGGGAAAAADERGASVAPGGPPAARRPGEQGPPRDVRPRPRYDTPPGHDVTGILRLDPRVTATMAEAATYVLPFLRGNARGLGRATAVNFVVDNEHVMTWFAKLTAACFLTARIMSGAISVPAKMQGASFHTRDDARDYLIKHTSFSGGRVRFHPIAGGPAARTGDFPRTDFMSWGSETGYASVDGPAGLGGGGGGGGGGPPRSPEARMRAGLEAYMPSNVRAF